MHDAYIVAPVRTPIGRFGGALEDFSPVALGAHVMRAALDRSRLDGSELDLYIFGNVLRAGQGQLMPRQAAIRAGIPAEIDGYAVDMVCSGSMMAANNAANLVRLGEADIVLTGGIESMSQTGFYVSHRARWGYKLLSGQPENLTDLLLHDGLTDPITDESMGEQTERLAAEHAVSRHELDEVAFMSHHRAAEATEKGWFRREIAPVEGRTPKGLTIDRDEGIRRDTTIETLGKLPPAFREDGVLTAGNSSQMSDGATAFIIASDGALAGHNLEPRARVLGCAWTGGETWRFPEAATVAVRKLLAKLRLDLVDFDVFENNEAFALSNILFHRALGVPYTQLNLFGGAVALGHPLGASGARIIVTLLNVMEHHDARRGLAAICHGSGGATAFAVERCSG